MDHLLPYLAWPDTRSTVDKSGRFWVGTPALKAASSTTAMPVLTIDVLPSIGPQRARRIDAHGAPGRHQRREQSDARDHHHGCGKRRRVERVDAKEQAPQKAGAKTGDDRTRRRGITARE